MVLGLPSVLDTQAHADPSVDGQGPSTPHQEWITEWKQAPSAAALCPSCSGYHPHPEPPHWSGGGRGPPPPVDRGRSWTLFW